MAHPNASLHSPERGTAHVIAALVVAALTVAAALCARPAPAAAQERDGDKSATPTDASGNRKELHKMTDEELRAAGFQWESESDHAPSLGAGFLAVGPGLVLHGIGHFYVRNQHSGELLLIGEGIGAGLMGLGLLLRLATESPGSFQGRSGDALIQLGGGIFGMTYAIDIMGAFKGTRDDFQKLPTMPKGGRLRAGYSGFVAPDLPCAPCNLLDLDLTMEFDSILIQPHARQDLLGDLTLLGLGVEWRVVPGTTPMDYVALVLDLEETGFLFGGLSNTPVRLEAALAISFDVGTYFEHLSNTVQRTTLGFGYGWNVGERALLPGERSAGYAVFEQAFAFHLNHDVVLTPYYTYSQSEPLTPIASFIGYFGTEASWFFLDDTAAYIDAQAGRGFAVSLGVQYALWR